MNRPGTSGKAVPRSNELCRRTLICGIGVFLLILPLLSQQFSKVTEGSPATNIAAARSVNWIDYNGDGYLDLLVSRGKAGGQNNALYRNDGPPNFTFTKMDTLIVSLDGRPSDGSSWGDYDNDGNTDLFVVNWYGVNNLLYKNHGNGQFQAITAGNPVNDGGYSETCSWGDYNNDGLLDLYVSNSAGNLKNFLYKNLGSGTFQKITTGPVVNDQEASRGVNWVDYDNDGDVDLFVVNENGGNESLYKNMFKETGVDSFLQVTAGALVSSGGNSWSASWGDYDNDGDLDVFITNFSGQPCYFFRNDGQGQFTRVYYGTLTSDVASFATASWVDYDNDGDLDLFITTAYGGTAGTCALYKNLLIENGSPSFQKVSGEPLLNETGYWYGLSWGDYDDDGNLDVFVAGTFNENSASLLYHNTGNGNNWVTLDCIGKFSNRSAIGAKIRIKATIGGNSVTQLREVDGQSGYCGQTLQQHFGLGNAGSVDSLIVEWPSGNQDIYTEIPANRHFAIVESDSAGPALAEPANGSNELYEGYALRWRRSYAGAPYRVQVSDDSTFQPGSVYIDSTVSDTALTLPYLPRAVNFWRVRSKREIHESVWSEVWKFTLGAASIDYDVAKRWNLISIPFNAENTNKSVLFPATLSSAFYYAAASYHPTDTLARGRGYWLRFSKNQHFQCAGDYVYAETIAVSDGWNLIGSIIRPVPASAVATDPPGILASSFFGFKGRYSPVDTLFPGGAYWVKISGSGSIVLDTTAGSISASAVAGSSTKVFEGLDKLVFRDAEGEERILFINAGSTMEPMREMPPIPPAGCFDVRFPEDASFENLAVENSRDVPIIVSGGKYPITLYYNFRAPIKNGYLHLGKERRIRLSGNGEIRLNLPDKDISIGLGDAAISEAPTVYRLEQNYPNPFNPATSLRYTLPAASRVTVKVFNSLGQEVYTLLDEVQVAGVKSVSWNAAGFSSGTYYYRLTASAIDDPARNFFGTGRMILLK